MGGRDLWIFEQSSIKMQNSFQYFEVDIGLWFWNWKMVDVLKLSCFQCLKMNLGHMLSFMCVGIYWTGYWVYNGIWWKIQGCFFLKVSKIPFVCVRVNLNWTGLPNRLTEAKILEDCSGIYLLSNTFSRLIHNIHDSYPD